jgi:branched-chain amino acid transport system ATP-binding protein
MPEHAPALSLKDVTFGYNGTAVVRSLSLDVMPGEVLALLGANGAGKSTTLLGVYGLVSLLDGEVEVLGQSVSSRNPYRLARRGVGFVPDDRALFFELTVGEHLRLSRRRPDRAVEERVLNQFPVLRKLNGRKAGLLSGGEQQMLAIAVTLMAEPRVLMIDEMSLGLAPKIVQEILPALRDMAKAQDIAVVLVEQHIDFALGVADRAVVLNRGREVLTGSARELLGDRDSLAKAYFGAQAQTPASA